MLVISASPDHRSSTATLRDVVAELRRRPEVTTHAWLLRHGTGRTWDGARVVDDLRADALAETVDRLRIAPVSDFVRGRRLRSWLARAAPDVVLLDDGLGTRLLDHLPGTSATIVRFNPERPTDEHLEPPAATSCDLTIASGGTVPAAVAAANTLMLPSLHDHELALPFVDWEARAMVRRRLGISVDGALIVGWSDDPTPAALRSFVGVLNTVGDGPDQAPNGLWLGGPPDALRIMEAEAERLSTRIRLHHRIATSVDARLCGDATFLPDSSRSTVEVREALVTGMAVVSHTSCGLKDPSVVVVPSDSNSDAAAALADAMAGGRNQRSAQAIDRYDVRPWVDRFLPVMRHLASRPPRSFAAG